MKKRKLLAALLLSFCVATSSASLAACTNKNDGYDPALYAAYQVYAKNTENPKSYKEWVADILAGLANGGAQGPQGEPGNDGADGADGMNGDGISDVKMVTINDKQYFEFIFTSGKIIRLAVDGSDRQETTAFTINAVDQFGDPVADAYFSVGLASMSGYLTASGTTNPNAANAYAVKSDSHGIATFYTFLPSPAAAAYYVYLADPLAISEHGDISATPAGYSVNFGVYESGPLQGMGKNNVGFEKVDELTYTATVNFRSDNSWSVLYDSENDLQYKRYVDTDNNYAVKVDYKPYEKRVSRNKYNYFTFEPYKLPNVDDSETAVATELSRKAASGTYRIGFRASGSANVSLNLYNFVGGNYFQSNEDGSPADSTVIMHSGSVPTESSVLQELFAQSGVADYGSWYADYTRTFSGGNFIDIEIPEEEATSIHSLGFVADANCTVTITVERLGNVIPWTTNEVVEKMPSGATKAKNVDGRIKEVPLDSVTVKGSDGYYHIGNADGPIIYVQLKKSTRVNNESMEYLAEYEIEDSRGTIIQKTFVYTTEDAANHVRTINDYTAIVKGYAALVNKDGLYPVNDKLKAVLDRFCLSMLGAQEYEEYWVAACSYYGPESDGSMENPYDLTIDTVPFPKDTQNKVTFTGNSAYVAFKAPTSNYFGFSITGGSIVGLDGSITVGDTEYVKIEENGTVLFRVTGSGEVTVTVKQILDNVYLRYYETEIDTGDTFIVTEHGTESNPLSVSSTGVMLVGIDHEMYNGILYINLTAPLFQGGQYTITVYGSATATIVNAEGQSVIGNEITLNDETATLLKIDDTVDGEFIIVVKKV